ncbi:pilus assembly protein [Steroidobacter agaridevorans]|uniref:pilus assembly protein n=1 Tax=Steroidobacter agaridevorans TaxID=2695856 RepID=UPI001379E81C|nr:PilC/PilY family type IV pilus protein [Steroidobacter agaridevorans]
MSMSKETPRAWRYVLAKLRYALAGALLTVLAGAASGQTASNTVAQSPLTVAGNVPGNLLLVPSVEYPTLDSMANLGNYDVARAYTGYFDPAKCYKYSYSATETDRYFYPVGKSETRTCSSSLQQWSGNYLNWATTQTIDPFRKALTGGHRVKDEANVTWLEKARYDGNGANSLFPNRRIPASGSSSSLVSGATPASWSDFTYRIWTLGNRMRFTRSGNLNSDPVIAYDPSTHTSLDGSKVYEVSVRVKVCDSSIGVESNCVQYSSGWKPEGLIQKYSSRIRYSVFGYLNDSNILRDGGVLRARQKFVGEYKLDPSSNLLVANGNREWDPATGILVPNPDAADASATAGVVGQTIKFSGVINYINRFGQMTTQNHKSYDPVSELYYAAIRYLKRQGNVPEYSGLSGTSSQRYNYADGFPVITDWDDPMQYSCQNNALLGIGDVNTHRDKDLPGSGSTTDEPARPGAVSSDKTVNVVTATQKVAQLEGITIATPFTGRENSAFIAGLAYDSHTKDLRSDLEGKQTVSTYWVDVREAQVLEPRARNQYWLAAKYGGFNVPDDYEPYKQTKALDASLWSSGETLSTGDLRPENFYVASEADKMVESLTRAFAKIAAETQGAGTALSSTSSQLRTDTKIFQAVFYNGTWRGDLRAYSLDEKGLVSSSPQWRAGVNLTARDWSTRRIYFYNPQGKNAGAQYAEFTWDNLGSTQKTALGSEDVVNYLAGDRSKEESQTNGTLRTRTGVLGDIVNSSPVYVAAPNASLYERASFTGASSYVKFANSMSKRTPVVYVGANDGMLHGFDASDDEAERGEETYAFVPNGAILNGLRTYSEPTYEHRYFVDGEMVVTDVYDTRDKRWKTILVGTMGRGGPGVFALDVTDPADVTFLWEKNGADIPALGKNIGRPVIAQVADGDWRVLMGNGHATSAGSAQLIMINVITGAVTTADTGASGSNALSAVMARDSDGDRISDVAYAGDLKGNLWKFSSLNGTPSATKMFQARDPSGNAQPITAAPIAGRDPSTGTVWVFFGTGRYLNAADLNDRQVQSWYGIKDSSVSTATRGDLVQRDIIAESQRDTLTLRAVEEGSAGDLKGRRGWYMDLISPGRAPRGERVIVPNQFVGTALLATTRIPEAADICKPTGTGFIMAIDPFTGARMPDTFFDVSRDGKYTSLDHMSMESGSGTSQDGVVVSGVAVGDAIAGQTTVVGSDIHFQTTGGVQDQLGFQVPATAAGRMSWREIVN